MSTANFEADAKREADARVIWALKTLWKATAKEYHISQPYPWNGAWRLICSNPHRDYKDTFYEGVTPELCCEACAKSLIATDPSLDPDSGCSCPDAYHGIHISPTCAARQTTQVAAGNACLWCKGTHKHKVPEGCV